MKGKGAWELPGLTAQEILEAHFKNELDEEAGTQSVVRAAEFLKDNEFEVWEIREVRESPQEGTVWRDALDKFWLVYHETGDIVRAAEREE